MPEVLAVMATAGLYDDSGKWLYHTGLPAKSGVGGGIIAVSPGKFGIAVVAPPLDEAGNSVKGSGRLRTSRTRSEGIRFLSGDNNELNPGDRHETHSGVDGIVGNCSRGALPLHRPNVEISGVGGWVFSDGVSGDADSAGWADLRSHRSEGLCQLRVQRGVLAPITQRTG